MNSSNEFVCSLTPFTVRRTVRWIDCDPAGYAFVGAINYYLISAMMQFYRHINFGPESVSDNLDLGLPCKHMALTFHHSLKPNTCIDISIQVGEIREHSFDLQAKAYLPCQKIAFEGQFSPICTHSDYQVSVQIPEKLRHQLYQHQLHSVEIKK